MTETWEGSWLGARYRGRYNVIAATIMVGGWWDHLLGLIVRTIPSRILIGIYLSVDLDS